MASPWVESYKTRSGQTRFRVRYTLGGRGSRRHHGGSFKRKSDANVRAAWIRTQLAAMCVPDLRLLGVEPELSPRVREAVDRWRASRIDVSEGTRTNDRVNTDRVLNHDPSLARCRLDELDVERWAQVFRELGAKLDERGQPGFRKGTLKKSREAFAMVYDHFAIEPNPVRDPRVKLPYERPSDMVVPIAAHVEAVAQVLPAQYLLPYLMIDWTGLRLGAIEGAKVAELDEHRQALLAKVSIAKNRKPVWVGLHDVLFETIVAQLPPREDRDRDAPLFPGFKGANLRTAITRACRVTGTPHFSPHELRKRRGSLLGKQGYSLAEIAERLGDTKVVTAEHYMFAIGDYAEADYAAVLSR